MHRFPYAFVKYLKYALAVAEIFLAVRLVLKFLGASTVAIIVQFFYVLTDIIIVPFQGIFANPHLSNGSVIDLVALATMIGYPIIIYLLIELLHLLTHKEEMTSLK